MSLNLDKIFLPLLKILPCYEAFFGNLIFAIIAQMLCGNHLKLTQDCQYVLSDLLPECNLLVQGPKITTITVCQNGFKFYCGVLR